MNATILHGTDGSPEENWFRWLEGKLAERGYETWVPQLPHCEEPDLANYLPFLKAEAPFAIGNDSILIGHSSGAVTILAWLQRIEEPVHAVYLVGSFKDDLGWAALKNLWNEPLDYEAIKSKSKRFVFVHSDDDPYCPLEHAIFQSTAVGGELVVIPGQKHFSTEAGDQYKQFPALLELIDQD